MPCLFDRAAMPASRPFFLLLLAVIPLSALAQSASDAVRRGAVRVEPRYASALAGYHRYADQPVQSWASSNELVARIGGWQTYARESQATAVDTSARTGKSGAAPAPATSGQQADHQSHH
jgi:hypothetical protein